MELFEAVKARHSVRSYTSRPLEPEIIQALQAETDACNREGGLHIQLVTEEPAAFRAFCPITANSAVSRTIWLWSVPKVRSWKKRLVIMGNAWS